jgi:phosphatidylglycerophosphate synthase
MLDARLQTLLAPPLNRAGQILARAGVTANAVTMSGLAVDVVAIVAIACAHYTWGLAFIVLSRILDGLDGAVARVTVRSALGGYLDIVTDYVFYAGVPFGFAWAAPASNALAAAALLATFLLTCSSFLAFAALAVQRGLEQESQRQKSFFYSTGLIEGTETIAFFVAMVVWPARFACLAWICAGLCGMTALQRSGAAVRRFRDRCESPVTSVRKT